LLHDTLLSSSKHLLTLGKSLFLKLSVFQNFQLTSTPRYIVFYSWISSTFPRPPAKRAVAIALINAFAQLGNIAGSYVWGLKEDGYRKSYGIVTAMFGCTIVGALVLRMMLSRLNKRLEELEREETQAYATEKAREAEADEALRVQKGFRYLV
jgi:predicted MFS family arabinose efflux permease